MSGSKPALGQKLTLPSNGGSGSAKATRDKRVANTARSSAADSRNGGALCVSSDGGHVYATVEGSGLVHGLPLDPSSNGRAFLSKKVSSVSLPAAPDAGTRADGSAVAMELVGGRAQDVLVVTDGAGGGRLVTFARDEATGALQAPALDELPMSAPCSLAALRGAV